MPQLPPLRALISTVSVIGGSGEKKTLRLVAQYADMWNGFGDPDTIRQKLQVLADHCADVGRDPSEITKTRLGTLFVATTEEEAHARREEFKRDMIAWHEKFKSELGYDQPRQYVVTYGIRK